MKNILLIIALLSGFLLLTGCDSQNQYSGSEASGNYNSFNNRVDEDNFDDGYSWAEDNDIDNFSDCQDEFGTSDAEDGCNDYVKDNYTGSQTFGDYECTEDCSGHEAGYEWAEENGISDSYDCDGNSQSFNEGCETYVEENY